MTIVERTLLTIKSHASTGIEPISSNRQGGVLTASDSWDVKVEKQEKRERGFFIYIPTFSFAGAAFNRQRIDLTIFCH